MRSLHTFIAAAVLLVATSATVTAGPPLICHPIDIGDASTLRGGDGPFGTDPSYDRSHLVEETLALLAPATPVLVRMETIRRATIYATALNTKKWKDESRMRDDARPAYALLEKLKNRMESTPGPASALALFDLGYYMECLNQAMSPGAFSGYELLKKAAAARANDAAMAFACALAGSWPKRDDAAAFLARARAGAKPGSLLEKNLKSHFAKS